MQHHYHIFFCTSCCSWLMHIWASNKPLGEAVCFSSQSLTILVPRRLPTSLLLLVLSNCIWTVVIPRKSPFHHPFRANPQCELIMLSLGLIVRRSPGSYIIRWLSGHTYGGNLIHLGHGAVQYSVDGAFHFCISSLFTIAVLKLQIENARQHGMPNNSVPRIFSRSRLTWPTETLGLILGTKNQVLSREIWHPSNCRQPRRNWLTLKKNGLLAATNW